MLTLGPLPYDVSMTAYPLARASVESFGPFQETEFEFSPGLNVIVGDNATGKSQLLKLLYSSTKSLKDASSLTKKELGPALAAKLCGVFRPDSLGRLTYRCQGRSRADIRLAYTDLDEDLAFHFSSTAQKEVVIDSHPRMSLEDQPVFLPPQELLTLSAKFLSFYDNYEVPFEETWRDTLELLFRPAVRGRRESQAAELARPLEAVLRGGKVTDTDGRFSVRQPGIGNLEAPLLAEGMRKLAMLARLIANGTILEGGYLFWDEPEANLNPASQRAVALALAHLASHGSQVFVATHSMYILRELEMEPRQAQPRYFGLSRSESLSDTDSIASISVQTSDSFAGLDTIAALAAEDAQAQRYLAW